MEAKHTPGPWYVIPYNNGHDNRETLQHRDEPLARPSYAFNTEPGCAQAEADRRNAAIAQATQ